ncbi:hypothetical protein B0T24DRAFT_718245 [Lasiosphaeria ovina]|uniref:Uncharacterized protein n=1 Tax=Lasiosphaeria ovina TaxID=92902 RepID=A0AAE0NAR6_9PEZI|nr:hypothetical protein B0T24DRAFT_718245 [Lasiosphaeria ovina]
MVSAAPEEAAKPKTPPTAAPTAAATATEATTTMTATSSSTSSTTATATAVTETAVGEFLQLYAIRTAAPAETDEPREAPTELRSLPAELIEEVCAALQDDRQALHNFRLTGSRYWATGGRFVLPVVRALFTMDSMRQLTRLSADHPQLAVGVRKLELSAAWIDHPHQRLDHVYLCRVYEARLHQALQPSAAADRPGFARLRHIILHCGHELPPAWPEPAELLEPAEPEYFTKEIRLRSGATPVRDVLGALESSGANGTLTRLELRGLDWAVFLNACTMNEFGGTDGDPPRLLPRLRHLRLDFDFQPHMWWYIDGDAEDDGHHTGTSRPVGGFLADRRMRALEVLDVRATGSTDQSLVTLADNWPGGINLKETISPRCFWPRLRVLRLDSVWCDGDELIKVLIRHEKTLRELKMVDVHLLSSWPRLLHSVRERLCLTTAVVDADPMLTGCSEEEDTKGAIEWWVIDDKLHRAIGDWLCCRTPGECPLNDDMLMHGCYQEP